MIAPNLPQWLVRLAVVVAVPGMACFSYYSLAYLGDEHASWSLPVLLAYPAPHQPRLGAVVTAAFQAQALAVGILFHHTGRVLACGADIGCSFSFQGKLCLDTRLIIF